VQLATGAMFAGLAVAVFASPGTPSGPLWVGGLIDAVLAAVWWGMFGRPMIGLGQDFAYIRNPFRSRRIPRGDVLTAYAAYLGVGIVTRSGGVTAWAVQKPRWAYMFHRECHADRVALDIVTWAKAR
jgi:hypothetical protein